MDWENLRSSLACSGLTAGPEWVLEALSARLCAAAARQGQELEQITLYLPPSAETRADRYRLRQHPAEPNCGGVVLELAPHGKDVADTFIAMDVSKAWHCNRQAAIIVSSDQALAYVAARQVGECGGQQMRLLHRRRRPVRIGGLLELGIAEWLDLDVGQQLARQPWSSWLEAAWRLRRLAGHTPDRVFHELLADESREYRADLWARTGEVAAGDWHRLEQVDDVVAALWRMSAGAPFTEEGAHVRVRQRLANDADHTDPRVVVSALLAAQLLRHRDPDHLEVPSSWREGLLLPIRRVVLRLAMHERGVDSRNLRHLHRSRFYSGRARAGARAGERHDELESHSSADSWDCVKHALQQGLSTINTENVRRSHDGKCVALWHLIWTTTARRIFEEARLIDRHVRLDAPCPTDELAAALVGRGIRYPKRWLRCLRDVGLVTQSNGLWRSTEWELRSP